MLAGSYLTGTKAGSGNRVKYILGYMLLGNQKGNDGEGLIMVQASGKGAHQRINTIDR